MTPLRASFWYGSTTVFLRINGAELRPDVDAAERLIVSVATGEIDEMKVIAEGLRGLQ